MDFSNFFDYPINDDEPEDETYQALTFLPNWDTNKWDKLLQHTQTQLFHEGETVIKAGDIERSIYIVAYGSLEILIKFRDKDTRINTISSGSVIGEQAFFDDQPRSASVRAITACQILRINYDSFISFAANEPALAREFILDLGRILSIRLRQTIARITG